MARKQMCALRVWYSIPSLLVIILQRRTMKQIKIATGNCDIPSQFCWQLENLIHHILIVPTEMRPSIEDAKRHPWVKEGEDFKPMRSWNPSREKKKRMDGYIF